MPPNMTPRALAAVQLNAIHVMGKVWDRRQAVWVFAIAIRPKKIQALFIIPWANCVNILMNLKKAVSAPPKNMSLAKSPITKRKKFIYSPANQSTQMIVGTDASSDHKILTLANHLYGKYQMHRVYSSTFSPIPDSAQLLPIASPSLKSVICVFKPCHIFS